MDPFSSTGISSSTRGSNGTFSFSKDRWCAIGQITSSLQVVLGFILFLLSSIFLIHSGKSSGQLIGALSVVLGLIGVLGLRSKQTALQLLFIVGMGMMAMMTFEFTVQVGRDVEVHCSLSEAYNRLEHLESHVTQMKHDDLLTQLFVRLNEMDDMLDMVQDGTIDKLDSRWRQQSLLQEDMEFIDQKVQLLKIHADAVMENLLQKSNEASKNEKQPTDPRLIKKQKEIEAALMSRLEQVEDVLDKIEDKENKDQKFTYKEYEQLYEALLGVHSDPQLLKKDQDDLPYLKESMDRLHSKAHEQESDQSKAIAKHREEQRERFEVSFLPASSVDMVCLQGAFIEAFETHKGTHRSDFDSSLLIAMDDLPEHCMVEAARYDYFLYGGWLLILVQMTAAYTSATSLFISNIKKDF